MTPMTRLLWKVQKAHGIEPYQRGGLQEKKRDELHTVSGVVVWTVFMGCSGVEVEEDSPRKMGILVSGASTTSCGARVPRDVPV